MTLSRLSLIPGGLAAGLTLMLLMAGCSSEPENSRSEAHARHKSPPPTPMAGQDTFFDGKILAELNVGASGFPDVPSAGGSGDKGGGDSSGGHHHGGYGGGGGGGHHRGGGGAPSDDSGERPAGARPMMGAMGPALMIHLRFTNRGTERVELGIDDFSSPLGNFAVQPEKLVLDPGQTLETEPMSSRLVEGMTEADATLALRIANHVEKKVVTLHAVPAPASAGAAGSPADTPPSDGKPAEKPSP